MSDVRSLVDGDTRRVIDGRAYNTKTATLVASACRGGYTDFGHWAEDLYRTKSRRFFLHGVGGPSSRWSQSTGQNSRSGGEGIKPLSEADAREWVEQHANDDYEAIFGAAPEA